MREKIEKIKEMVKELRYDRESDQKHFCVNIDCEEADILIDALIMYRTLLELKEQVEK